MKRSMCEQNGFPSLRLAARLLGLVAALWTAGVAGATVPAWPLNDTGIDWCASGSTNFLACPVTGYPAQDAEHGRDATQDDDSDGHAGFRFTKLDANGNPLPASAASWSCVRDEVSGLTWEVKTDDGGLRDKDWTYSWYNPDPTTNGGSAGTPDGTNNCYDPTRCDTDKFVADVNAVGLCGADDWRLPAREELRSIVDYSRTSPAIDATWFPRTRSSWYWSSSPDAGSAAFAWVVHFYYGGDGYGNKYGDGHVRLVRGGQALYAGASVGVWQPGTRRFLLDANGNGRWDGAAGGDNRTGAFGASTDHPVAGDWNGLGSDRIGVWRPSTRRFMLDANGNGRWDGAAGGDVLTAAFGASTDRPVIGDWNGDGKDEVGVWRPGTRKFLLDSNGNGRWDGALGGDTVTGVFGVSTDVPVTGDWDGDGRDDLGFWRPGTRKFYLDTNGNDAWDGVAGGDTLTPAFGLATDLPVIGDWDGDGTDDIGVWRPSTRRFLLDANGNDRWDGSAGGDTLSGPFGLDGDLPLGGRW